MGITVEELRAKFHNISDSEIIRLVGKEDFKSSDVIPLNNFATCSKKAYKEYAAQKEGLSFLGYVKGQEKFDLAKSAGLIKLAESAQTNPFAQSYQQQRSVASIPMGQSLFTVYKA